MYIKLMYMMWIMVKYLTKDKEELIVAWIMCPVCCHLKPTRQKCPYCEKLENIHPLK